jgi:hypothetical protein
MSDDKEAEARHEKILAGEKMMPNKPRKIKTQCNKRKGVCPRKVHKRGRRKTPRHRKNKKKRLRKQREQHQVLLSRRKARPRGQL